VIEHEQDRLDFSQVPQSAGFPRMLYALLAVGIIGIFAVGGAVVLNGGYGHHWPANTTQRVPLVNSDNP
jgi:hypothetical protein